MSMQDRFPLAGTAAIGVALFNTSSSTVMRLIKAKLLHAYKMPGRTSPWMCDRDEIERFKEAVRRGTIPPPHSSVSPPVVPMNGLTNG